MIEGAVARSERFEVSTPDFTGPMDLLVYLVRQREIDVAMISVAQLAEDYLKWWQSRLEQIDLPVSYNGDEENRENGYSYIGLDLDSAGEFVLLAAILLEYKAVSLLPMEQPDLSGIEVGSADDEWDPELLSQFQAPAQLLAELESKQINLFDRGAVHITGLDMEITSDMFSEVAVYDLALAFGRLNQELPPEKRHVVEGIPFTIEGQTSYILSFFEGTRKVSFEKLATGLTSRIAVVVTFLALLELIRRQKVAVIQTENFGSLWIIWREKRHEQ